MRRKGNDAIHELYDDDDDDEGYDDYDEGDADVARAKMHKMTLKVAPEAIPHCVGKGRSMLNSIEERHNCAIEFSRDNTGHVTLSGTLLDSLKRAKLDLLKIAAAVAPAGAEQVEAELCVVVQNISPGLAIGKGGENIRKAQAMLVRVDVDKEANEVRLYSKSKTHLEKAANFYRSLLQASFEKKVDLSPRVKRDFAKMAETMHGVIVRGAGQGSVVIRGERGKVLAAEAYLLMRENDEPRR